MDTSGTFFYAASTKAVLLNLHFPQIRVVYAWKQWWIGDKVRGILLIRMLTIEDIAFLDNLPLDEEEKHPRTGQHVDI